MPASTIPSTLDDIQLFRDEYRREMNCQIVHDSLHVRPGWTVPYRVAADGEPAGYGSVAVAGPWKDKPTIFEFYVLPAYRHRAFELFESFLATSDARFFEVQTNETILPVMLHAFGRDFATEKIVFEDGLTTHHPAGGSVLQPITSEPEILAALKRRGGGGEWRLEVDGTAVAEGGFLFHYNEPYADVYMEVNEAYRRRGYGTYLVQELKRKCRELGAVPCARCNPDNVASRKTLQKAGFIPCAAIITASIPRD